VNSQNTQLKTICQQIGSSYKPFLPIIREIIREYPNAPQQLHNKQLLELGPGRRFALLEYLSKYTNINAIGMETGNYAKHQKLKYGYLLEELKEIKTASIDLIYSRRVLEKHSFNPKLLLQSQPYKQLITKGHSKKIWQQYPGAKENILLCLQEITRILKKDAIIISHIGNRFAARFYQQTLTQLNLKQEYYKRVGLLGQIWTFRKTSFKIKK